jgi:hypothetical protein
MMPLNINKYIPFTQLCRWVGDLMEQTLVFSNNVVI